MIEMQGEIKAQLTPDGRNYFYDLINQPRKVVMTFDPKTMQKLRKLPPGGTIELHTASTLMNGDQKRTYKILRRDWKRSKLHLIEVK